MEKITIPIGGMHCASCALRIESSLKKVPGVNHATVNYATEAATEAFMTPLKKKDMPLFRTMT